MPMNAGLRGGTLVYFRLFCESVLPIGKRLGSENGQNSLLFVTLCCKNLFLPIGTTLANIFFIERKKMNEVKTEWVKIGR